MADDAYCAYCPHCEPDNCEAPVQTMVAGVKRDDLWRTIADAAGNMVGDFVPHATVDLVVDVILARYIVLDCPDCKPETTEKCRWCDGYGFGGVGSPLEVEIPCSYCAGSGLAAADDGVVMPGDHIQEVGDEVVALFDQIMTSEVFPPHYCHEFGGPVEAARCLACRLSRLRGYDERADAKVERKAKLDGEVAWRALCKLMRLRSLRTDMFMVELTDEELDVVAEAIFDANEEGLIG